MVIANKCHKKELSTLPVVSGVGRTWKVLQHTVNAAGTLGHLYAFFAQPRTYRHRVFAVLHRLRGPKAGPGETGIGPHTV